MEPATLTFLFIIFILACTVGYFVVWGVTPALHTPLMAVTNAISGIVIVAAMLLVAQPAPQSALCRILPCPAPGLVDIGYYIGLVLGFVAIVLCAINIFGGFTITRRMLSMYKAKSSAPANAGNDKAVTKKKLNPLRLALFFVAAYFAIDIVYTVVFLVGTKDVSFTFAYFLVSTVANLARPLVLAASLVLALLAEKYVMDKK